VIHADELLERMLHSLRFLILDLNFLFLEQLCLWSVLRFLLIVLVSDALTPTMRVRVRVRVRVILGLGFGLGS